MLTKVIEDVKNQDLVINDMYNEISDIITNNKTKMIYQINNSLVETNYMIGKIIVLTQKHKRSSTS